VTVESTTSVVLSATSTIFETVYQTEYTLKRRSHVRKNAVQERAAAPEVTARAVLPKKMLLYARQAASTTMKTLDTSALGAALSSACSCLFLPPLTAFDTSTAPFVVSIGQSKR
jgi:hypothetical protein